VGAVNVQAVLDEVADALRGIAPLSGRTYPWNVGKISPPAAVVDLPEAVDYHQTYGGVGADKISLTFMVLVGQLNSESVSKDLAAYLSGSGDRSVKAHVEGRIYQACDEVTVMSAEVLVATFAQVQYLAAQFTAEALGTGG
jgi:hypothetical protein